MAEKILNIKLFSGGISKSLKIGNLGAFSFANNLNIFDEASQINLLPKPTMVSGSIVDGLIKWIVTGAPYDTNKYFYDENGKIYQETSDGTWSSLQTTANSGGQGLEMYQDYIYYTQNTQIGRYGPLSNSPTFDDDWQTGLNDTSTIGFAPIKAFKEGFAVGHGNMVGWWDGSVWINAVLTLPPGFNVRTLEVIDEFLVVGVFKGTSLTNNDEGYLFFWDGASTTFNFFTSIPEGGINALGNSKNRLFSVIGTNGNLFLNYQPFQRINRIPLSTLADTLEIYPGAVTNWQNLMYIGVAGSTDNTGLVQGVYAWGSKSDEYDEVLNYNYSISTGTTSGTSLKIGAIKGFGNDLYIAWRDDTAYGVDKVSNNGNPYASGSFESLIFDNGQLYTDKLAKTIKIYHSALLTDESIQISYKTNRASSWTDGNANDTEGSTETRLNVPPSDALFREFQIKVTLATAGTTSPTVYYVGMLFDDKSDDKDY